MFLSSEVQTLLDKLWVWLEEGKLRKHLRLPRLAMQEHRELEAETVHVHIGCSKISTTDATCFTGFAIASVTSCWWFSLRDPSTTRCMKKALLSAQS